ncbi:hypothetical protein FRC12_004078 [Ceratobasidium sp. 428]|nr:hypothetical protein FRC12_004078 [Ceratobasidium sp. 428]
MLYQDVLLESPIQLVNLFRSINATHNLENTHRLTIERCVIADVDSWETIDRELRPAEYLGYVLRMTTSLRILSVEPGDTFPTIDQPAWRLERSFFAELCKRALNPTFLPSLSRLQSPLLLLILPLCKGRPLEHITSQDFPHFPAINTTRCYHPAGISPTHLSVNFPIPMIYGNLEWSAQGIRSNLEACAGTGLTIKHLKLVVYHRVGLDPAVPNLDASVWVKMILSTQACDQLESLYLAPEPPLIHYSLKGQIAAIQTAALLAPSLSYVVLWTPDLEWRRHVDERSDQTTRLPEWTPCPICSDPEVLNWWINALGIDIATEVKVGGLEGLAIQMRGIMRTRWSSALVPSVEVLQKRLSIALAADEVI